jgi:hypothetical protein
VPAENHLLSLLDSSTQSLLKPHMRTITVEHGEVLHGSSSNIEFAYFPQSMIISFLAPDMARPPRLPSLAERE